MLVAIWAQDQQGLIGKNHQLPWHLPNDLKFFKEKTRGHTLVMGRKTFEGMGKRALPNRQTIVLTTDHAYQAEHVQIMHDVAEVLTYAKAHPEQLIFIAGGSAVYQNLLPYCDCLYRTVIQATFEGDTYFPAFDWTPWRLLTQEAHQPDEKNHYAYQFETYERIRQ